MIKIPFIDKFDQILDAAFRKARKEAEKKPSRGPKLLIVKKKELTRIQESYLYLDMRLERICEHIPNLNKIHPFYKELLDVTIDVDELKKIISKINSVRKIMKEIKHKKISQIRGVKRPEDHHKIVKYRASYYGRLSSLMKSLNSSFLKLNDMGKKLKELPAIKPSLPTIVLSGFPNVGKTTILKRLTPSKAKVATYSFTTKSIQVGYFEHKFYKFQLVDTPGLLDRPVEKRNDIEKKAIAALKNISRLVLFVFDPSETCGYEIEDQISLYKQVKEEMDVSFVAILNKCDLATQEQKDKIKVGRVKKIETGKNDSELLGNISEDIMKVV